jgi:hypothetical protein
MRAAIYKSQNTNYNSKAAQKLLCSLFFVVCSFVVSRAASPRVSPTGFIEYWPGTLPIILSAPHGGSLAPKELPDRQYGKIMRDEKTIELATAMRDELQKKYGAAPALIICRVTRHKLDCNREIVEAAQGDALAEKGWKEYHAFIDEAERDLLKRHPHGLYLDIHGHAHAKQRVELGYAITSKDLLLPDADLDKLAAKSSIRGLQAVTKTPLSQLLRGPASLGALLGASGISCVPAPEAVLEKDDSYFDGGYDIRQHGSMNGGKIDAIQLEHPKSLRDTKEHRATMATALTEALGKFWEANYGTALKAN